jgi:uncharacterized membrane protein
MIQMYIFFRSPHRRTERSMQRIIRIPPIVGVPDLFMCVFGPSSRICCVILNLFILPIIHGPRRREKTIAVSTAREVLKVMYLKTFRGENQSCKLYKRLYNI